MSSALPPAYVVAARRSALGRPGGLHRARRIEALASPVAQAALADAGIAGDEVGEIIVGSTAEGANPARLIGLAAGLPDAVPAHTLDRDCASGLDAILAGLRSVATGEASIVLAGGADSLSTAPWRVYRPPALHQTPRFRDPAAETADGEGRAGAEEALAQRFQIGRARLDAFALDCRRRAAAAQAEGRFMAEIVALRKQPEEARDEGLAEVATAEDLAELDSLVEGGAITAGTLSGLRDGAAMAVLVDQAAWERLGRPPGLRLLASAAAGATAGQEAGGPIEAAHKLYRRMNGFKRDGIGAFELGESSAAQAVAFNDSLGLKADQLNRDGGELARGRPLGASGAVALVRLFGRLVRAAKPASRLGVVASGAAGGLGVAALFERV